MTDNGPTEGSSRASAGVVVELSSMTAWPGSTKRSAYRSRMRATAACAPATGRSST
jgi:hypothetical protein